MILLNSNGVEQQKENLSYIHYILIFIYIYKESLIVFFLGHLKGSVIGDRGQNEKMNITHKLRKIH